MSSLAPPHHVVLEGLVHLANFLITQADIMENEAEEDKKRSFIYNKVPAEVVKDPSGLARELLWRVQRELGHTTVKHEITPTAPAEPVASNGANTKHVPINNVKSQRQARALRYPAVSRIANFDPP
jgi:F-box/leucine-rich repeat protein 10/11